MDMGISGRNRANRFTLLKMAVLILIVDFRYRRLRFPRACRGASSALLAPAGSPLPRTPAGVFAAFRSNQHAKNQY